MNDLLSDEEVLQSQKRADAFISGGDSFAGMKVRPFTAGSLLICKRVGNSLVIGGQSQDPEFDVLSFIYIHSAPIEQVRKNSFSKELFWASVTDWADKLSVKDIEQASTLVEKIILDSGVGVAVPSGDSKGDSSPN
jgi:hypothetical protein